MKTYTKIVGALLLALGCITPVKAQLALVGDAKDVCRCFCDQPAPDNGRLSIKSDVFDTEYDYTVDGNNETKEEKQANCESRNKQTCEGFNVSGERKYGTHTGCFLIGVAAGSESIEDLLELPWSY